jgi:drug/metabolite transporter (DMT)-like permease
LAALAIVVLVLVSALLHAMWNAGLRMERDKDRAVVVAIAVATLVAGVVAVVSWGRGASPFPTGESLGWTLVAGLAEGVYFAGLARALELGPLGPVYTVSRGGAVLVVWPVSLALWDEALTPGGIAGSAIVLAGLVFSGAERGAPGRAIAWAAACAACIAGYHLAYKGALDAGGEPAAVFALSLGAATVINIVRLGASGRRMARELFARRWLHLSVIGTIASVAFLLLMWGLAKGGGAGLVLTLRNTSVVFATGFAALIGDRPGYRQVVGSVLVAGGAAILAAT